MDTTHRHPLSSAAWTALILGGAAFLIGAFSLLAYGSYQGLVKTERAQQQELALRSRAAFLSHVSRLLDYGDSTLRSIRAVYVHTGSIEEVYAHVAEAKAPGPDAFSGVIAGIDQTGTIIFHSHDRQLLMPRFNTDLEAFRTFKENPTDRLFLDPTRVGRHTGLIQFRLVRPILHDARFGGILILNIDPALVADFARSLNLGANAVTMVVTPDARLIAQDPLNSPDDYTAPAPGADLWRRLNLTQQPEGRLEHPIVINGVPRTFYYAKVKDYPVVVAIGIAERDLDTSMRDPRRNLLLLTAGFAITTAIIASLLVAFLHANQRLIAANKIAQDANQRLSHSNAMLERSNADLEQFAYVASHDLQTPLRTMTSFAQLLSLRYGEVLDQDGRDFIQFISTGAQQMSNLVRDLLGYARVSSQGRTLVDCDPNAILHDVYEHLRQHIAECDAKIVASPLPHILGDPTQLNSLFQNLLENALKYRRQDIAPEIHIWAKRDTAGMWRFYVADNGIGIDPEYYDKIFVIFQRLHPSGQYEGTGIGLALCKRIVTRMGGEISVSPNPKGVGTVFTFTAMAVS